MGQYLGILGVGLVVNLISAIALQTFSKIKNYENKKSDDIK
jgi:hypothetical protein